MLPAGSMALSYAAHESDCGPSGSAAAMAGLRAMIGEGSRWTSWCRG